MPVSQFNFHFFKRLKNFVLHIENSLNQDLLWKEQNHDSWEGSKIEKKTLLTDALKREFFFYILFHMVPQA